MRLLLPPFNPPRIAQTEWREPRVKGILRVDDARRWVHGYSVQVRLPGGRRHNKYFSDLKHGGRRGAFDAALSHRNELFRKLGLPVTERYRATLQPAHSNTGVTGVARRECARQSGREAHRRPNRGRRPRGRAEGSASGSEFYGQRPARTATNSHHLKGVSHDRTKHYHEGRHEGQGRGW